MHNFSGLGEYTHKSISLETWQEFFMIIGTYVLCEFNWINIWYATATDSHIEWLKSQVTRGDIDFLGEKSNFL